MWIISESLDGLKEILVRCEHAGGLEGFVNIGINQCPIELVIAFHLEHSGTAFVVSAWSSRDAAAT